MSCTSTRAVLYLEESDRKADVCKRAIIVRTRHMPPPSTCHGREDNRLRCCARRRRVDAPTRPSREARCLQQGAKILCVARSVQSAAAHLAHGGARGSALPVGTHARVVVCTGPHPQDHGRPPSYITTAAIGASRCHRGSPTDGTGERRAPRRPPWHRRVGNATACKRPLCGLCLCGYAGSGGDTPAAHATNLVTGGHAGGSTPTAAPLRRKADGPTRCGAPMPAPRVPPPQLAPHRRGCCGAHLPPPLCSPWRHCHVATARGRRRGGALTSARSLPAVPRAHACGAGNGGAR